MPQAKPPRADRTLTDTIESALKDAGAKPLETINPIEPSAASAAPATGRVDILA